MPKNDFDVDEFLARPLTARVATNGPTVRPTWYLWEDQAFWILSGPWARLPDRVRADPVIALVVDVCDLPTGSVHQVIARGNAEVLPFDIPRGHRKLARYLGPEETAWDPRFRSYLHDDPGQRGTIWIRLRPTSLKATDLSYQAGSLEQEAGGERVLGVEEVLGGAGDPGAAGDGRHDGR